MPEPYDAMRQLLSDRPIAFHPMLARLLGGINEALLFQQLAYWSGKGRDPDWIYKTQAELEEETTLSRYQQEQARGKLRRLGILEEQRRGVPAKLYYRVVWEAVFRVLETGIQERKTSQPSLRETPILDRELPSSRGTDAQEREELPDQSASNSPTITESTNRENNKEDLSNNSTDLPIMSREETERIAWVIQDVAREFTDQASLKSSAARACRLYLRSGYELTDFLDMLQQARLRTKRYTGSIKAAPVERGGLPVKPKMAYFFAVLEDLTAHKKAS